LKSQIDGLQERCGDLEGPIRRLEDRKSELILQTQDPYFFQNADVRIATYNEIHNLDQFMQLHHEVAASIAALSERLGQEASSRSDDSGLNERIDAIARKLDHLAFVSHCKDARDLGDSIISVALVNRSGEAENGVEKLARMYEGLAVRHGLTPEILGEFYDNRQDRAYLLIAGLGTYGLLKNESGLHQIDRRFKEKTPRSGREVVRQHREMLRVEVHTATPSPARDFQKQVKVKVAALKPVRKRLIQADVCVSLFHEPSVRSLELWTRGSSQEVIDKSLSILHAELQSRTPVDESLPVIREYDIGMSAKVKDNRTGRNTTRVNRVLKGDLGALLM
jgi:hypothetical protein